MIFILTAFSAFLFFFHETTLIKKYFYLDKICFKKSNELKKLNHKVNGFKELEPLKLRYGNRRLSTNLLSILSFIEYINKKKGLNIDVKVLRPGVPVRVSGAGPASKKPDAFPRAGKELAVKSKNFKSMGNIFEIIKTLQEFPVEIKKMIINPEEKYAEINIKLFAVFDKIQGNKPGISSGLNFLNDIYILPEGFTRKYDNFFDFPRNISINHYFPGMIYPPFPGRGFSMVNNAGFGPLTGESKPGLLFISSSSKGGTISRTAIIKIKGRNYFVHEGDFISGLRILKISAHSLNYIKNGVTGRISFMGF